MGKEGSKLVDELNFLLLLLLLLDPPVADEDEGASEAGREV